MAGRKRAMEVLKAAREAKAVADAAAAAKVRVCERSVRMQTRGRKRAAMLRDGSDAGESQQERVKRQREAPGEAVRGTGAEEVDGDTRSFVAYREMRPGVVWVDEVHTAEGNGEKG